LTKYHQRGVSATVGILPRHDELLPTLREDKNSKEVVREVRGQVLEDRKQSRSYHADIRVLMDSRYSNFFDQSSGCSRQGVSAACSGHANGRDLNDEMRRFFGERANDLPGSNNEIGRAEEAYAKNVALVFATVAQKNKKKPRPKNRPTLKQGKKPTQQQKDQAEADNQRRGGNNEDDERPKPGVEFLRDNSGNLSYAPDREGRILKAITALYTAECTDAFGSIGLESPVSIVNRKGVVVGPSTLAQVPGNAGYMGIPENSRAKMVPYVGRGDAKALSVIGKYNADGRGRIFLNGSAFPAGLVGVLAHEFIHLAGVEPVDPPVYKPWQDDLSFDHRYQKVIDTCVKAGERYSN
jgi:hypothetical protein